MIFGPHIILFICEGEAREWGLVEHFPIRV